MANMIVSQHSSGSAPILVILKTARNAMFLVEPRARARVNFACILSEENVCKLRDEGTGSDVHSLATLPALYTQPCLAFSG